MAQANNQTRLTGASVDKFLNSVTDERQRADSFRVVEMMERTTGEGAKMWGPAIIGFGLLHLKYASGRELDSPIVAFSPRKANITFYVQSGSPNEDKLLKKLGKHKISGGCLHIKKLADIDEQILEKLVTDSYQHIKKTA